MALVLSRTTSATAHQWAAIVAFYAAVHWVDSAVLERAGTRPPNHEERNRTVRANHQSMEEDYRRLYQRSRLLRYDLDEVQPGELSRLFEAVERIRRYVQPAS